MLNSTEHEFQLFIRTKILKMNKYFACFKKDIVFILLSATARIPVDQISRPLARYGLPSPGGIS